MDHHHNIATVHDTHNTHNNHNVENHVIGDSAIHNNHSVLHHDTHHDVIQHHNNDNYHHINTECYDKMTFDEIKRAVENPWTLLFHSSPAC